MKDYSKESDDTLLQLYKDLWQKGILEYKLSKTQYHGGVINLPSENHPDDTRHFRNYINIYCQIYELDQYISSERPNIQTVEWLASDKDGKTFDYALEMMLVAKRMAPCYRL